MAQKDTEPNRKNVAASKAKGWFHEAQIEAETGVIPILAVQAQPVTVGSS